MRGDGTQHHPRLRDDAVGRELRPRLSARQRHAPEREGVGVVLPGADRRAAEVPAGVEGASGAGRQPVVSFVQRAYAAFAARRISGLSGVAMSSSVRPCPSRRHGSASSTATCRRRSLGPSSRRRRSRRSRSTSSRNEARRVDRTRRLLFHSVAAAPPRSHQKKIEKRTGVKVPTMRVPLMSASAPPGSWVTSPLIFATLRS